MEKLPFFKRAIQAARYTISGITPQTWFSPLNPLVPYQPIVEGRQFDYNVGYNIFYTPRGTERLSFAQLRSAARQSQLIRMAIETRMDQMDALSWYIGARDEDQSTDNDPRIKKISKFFEKPDQIYDWPAWSRKLLEELFVTDALSLYRRKNRGGGLYGIEILDGSTMFPLIDEFGRRPQPPNPAFQQILKGVPKNDYTSEELIYAPRKTQVNTPYGYSVVEQIFETAQTTIQRANYQLTYFTDGSVPDAYITAPDNMTPDRVKAFEVNLNTLFAGNLAGRRQMPVLLHGMEVHQLKEPPLMTEFDEWLSRIVCFAFSLPPTAFVKQMNRAQAGSEKERAEEEGLHPLMLYIKRLMDRFIAEDFDAPDLEWKWDTEEERDPDVAVKIDVALVESGIMTLNEVRSSRGLEPIEGGDIAMCKTANGYVPIDPQAALELKLKAQPPALENPTGNQEPKAKPTVKKKPSVSNIYAMKH